MKDRVVELLVGKLIGRSSIGMEKYGVGLDRKDLSTNQWLTHLQEELLDAAGYVEALLNKDEEAWLFVEVCAIGWFYIPERLSSEFNTWAGKFLIDKPVADATKFDEFKCNHPSFYRFELQPESLDG